MSRGENHLRYASCTHQCFERGKRRLSQAPASHLAQQKNLAPRSVRSTTGNFICSSVRPLAFGRRGHGFIESLQLVPARKGEEP
jgi:hypothetical protein